MVRRIGWGGAAVTLAVVLVLAMVGLRVGPGSAQGEMTPTAAASPGAGTAVASPMASPAAGQSVNVELVDIAFNPKEITIPANTDVVVNLKNSGAATHNFNIDQLNVHSGDISAGQTGTVTINAAPGDYEYYCSIPGHKEAGMVGTLHVQ